MSTSKKRQKLIDIDTHNCTNCEKIILTSPPNYQCDQGHQFCRNCMNHAKLRKPGCKKCKMGKIQNGLNGKSEVKHNSNSSSIKCVFSQVPKCLEVLTMGEIYDHLTKLHEVKTVTYDEWSNWTVYMDKWNDLKKVNVKAFKYDKQTFLQHVIWDKDQVHYWVSVIADEETARKYIFGFMGLKSTHGRISMSLNRPVVSVRNSHWPTNVHLEESNGFVSVISISRKFIMALSKQATNPKNGFVYAHSWTECFKLKENLNHL